MEKISSDEWYKVIRLAYTLMTLFEIQGSDLYLFEVNELNNLEYYNKHLEILEMMISSNLDNMDVYLKMIIWFQE